MSTIRSWNKRGAKNFMACMKKDDKDDLCALLIFTYKDKIKYGGYKGDAMEVYDLIEEAVENFYKI